MHRFILAMVMFLFVSAVYAQTTNQLLMQLKDPEARVRRIAAEKLGRMKVEKAGADIAELLKDKDKDVRQAAVRSLLNLGISAVPDLARALSFPEENSRLAAVEALLELAPVAKKAVPALASALKDDNVDVRIHAALALGLLGEDAKEALPALREAAKDLSNVGRSHGSMPPGNVAVTAIRAVLRIDPKCQESLAQHVLPEIVKGLQSKDMHDVEAAMSSIRLLGTHAKSALPAMEEALGRTEELEKHDYERIIAELKGGKIFRLEVITDVNAPVKKRIKNLRYFTGSKPATEKLVSIYKSVLKDPDIQLRLEAVQLLDFLNLHPKEVIPSLIALLDDVALLRELKEDDLIARLLANSGKDAAPPLAEALKDHEKAGLARFRACRSLTYLGHRAKDVLVELEGCIEDPNLMIAIEASCAYVRAGGDFAKVKVTLKKGFQSKSEDLVALSALAVYRLGKTAAECVPDLVNLLKHAKPEIRMAACDALGKMGDEAQPAVRILAALIKDKNDRQRDVVVRCLDALGLLAKPALPELMELLQTPEDIQNLRDLLSLLGKLGPDAKDAVPALMELLKSKNVLYRGDIKKTLGRIGAKSALPMLIKTLDGSSSYDRASAAAALGFMGPDAAVALPKLKGLLDDPSESVRIWSLFALARITGKYEENIKAMLEYWQDEKEFQFVHREDTVYDIAQALEELGPHARLGRDLILRVWQTGRRRGHPCEPMNTWQRLPDFSETKPTLSFRN